LPFNHSGVLKALKLSGVPISHADGRGIKFWPFGCAGVFSYVSKNIGVLGLIVSKETHDILA